MADQNTGSGLSNFAPPIHPPQMNQQLSGYPGGMRGQFPDPYMAQGSAQRPMLPPPSGQMPPGQQQRFPMPPGAAMAYRPPGPPFPGQNPTMPPQPNAHSPRFAQQGSMDKNSSGNSPQMLPNNRPQNMVNGMHSSPRFPPPPGGGPQQFPAKAPSLPFANGPQNGVSPPHPNVPGPASVAPPPLPGQRYSHPGNLPPPPRAMQPPAGMPPVGMPPAGMPPSSQGQGPPLHGGQSAMNSTGDLPIPFHGQAQYSHQLGVNQNGGHSLTPTNSEPTSRHSSRAPSPIPGMKYDALEGQFPSSPQGQQRPFPGEATTPPHLTASGLPPAGQTAALPPPGIGLPPSQAMPPYAMPAVPPSASSQGGIAGKRVYPQMAPPQGNSQLAMGQPPMGQPIMGQPSMGQPSMGQPSMGQPSMGQPPMGQPSMGQPSMGQPSMGQPSMGQPLMGQPSMGQPPIGQPAMGQPSMPHTGGMQYANNSAPVMGQQQFSNNFPNMPQNNSLNSSFGKMNLQQHEGRPVNLLQERNLIPPGGVPDQKANLPSEFKKVNCNPELFRCTLSTLPNSQSLLNQCRLPLGILIHPFKDLSQLPVIQSNVIVRCRSCRTYINPFVNFVDMRRWKCNLCYRVNELPDEFNFDPVSKTYGEPQRRPEIRSATIEFIAPSEYMLRPPQPAVYLYVLDVSFNAISTGYLQIVCNTILDELDQIPGDARTQIGFITFDRSLHFYNLDEGLSQPQMLVVSDVDDVFLPSPDNLLVNLSESKEMVIDLLNQLPSMFEQTTETGNALGAALQAAYKMMSPTGGRLSVFQTLLPNVGPGSLKNRENPNERAGKNIQHLGPVTDFYKKLALECSAQQIAVDLFAIAGQYVDLASIACISKYSGGCIHYFPALHIANNVAEADRFEGVLRRYLTRKIGFESVMRIRCTRGLSIHTFHGNFFVRSTDLLSLPNINPDAAFGMQMSIEDTLESNTACFQAALLYTSSKGERRIRVHTMCLPVSNQLPDVYAGADQKAIIGLLVKMGVDRSISSSLGDARDAMIYAAVDMLKSFGGTLHQSQRMGQLASAYTTRLMPLYITAMLKYTAFRIGSSTRLDERVFSMEKAKTMPLNLFLLELYPSLYPVHALDDQNAINKSDIVIPQPPRLQLSAAHLDRHGAYVLDCGSQIIMWVGAAVSDVYCQEVFDVAHFTSVVDGQTEIPELENSTSEKLRTFLQHLQDQRPFPASFHVIREDSRNRGMFLEHLVEDRTESTMSYYEFLQHCQKEVKF